MAKRKVILILGIAFMLLPGISFSQFSIGGGLSSFLGLNIPVKRWGFNVFAEIPRTHRNTFTIRGTYLLPIKYRNTYYVSGKPGVVPSKVKATEVSKTSFFSIDGGTRYYFINDYDIGFAMYAGGYLKGILSSYSSEYQLPGSLNKEDYQTSDYPAQPLLGRRPQYSVLFSFGGTVGVKYNLPTRGALTFDMGIEIISRIMDPSYILGNEISPLSFSFNLAYRFDWYDY